MTNFVAIKTAMSKVESMILIYDHAGESKAPYIRYSTFLASMKIFKYGSNDDAHKWHLKSTL